MKIVLFEFRKNILRKTVIIPMIILLIVNVIVIYAQYRFQNDPFSSEVNRYHSSAREWKYYKELHTQFDGEITEEKQDKIIKLYNNLKEKVDDGDYEKGYTKSAGTGYIFGDYSLIETNFYQPIKNLVSYVEKNGELVWKRVFEEYRKKLCLTGEESALIEEAGGALFGRSEEENHRRLTLILEQLDDRIKTVRGELGEKQKIYATVSMVMGGMLVILLI